MIRLGEYMNIAFELKNYRRDCLLGALGALLMLIGDLCLSIIPASPGDSGLYRRGIYLLRRAGALCRGCHTKTGEGSQMKLKELDENKIRDIGRAFGYYDYGGEKGLVSAYSGPEATAEYICGYVRGMLKGGFLYATSERGEGYIAFKRPGAKQGHENMLRCLKA